MSADFAGSSALARRASFTLPSASIARTRAHTSASPMRPEDASAANTGSQAAADSRPETKRARASAISSGSERASRSWNEYHVISTSSPTTRGYSARKTSHAPAAPSARSHSRRSPSESGEEG